MTIEIIIGQLQKYFHRKSLQKYLEGDNVKIQAFYENEWVQDVFELIKVNDRYILHGYFRDELIIMKVQEGRLRIGIPWEFVASKRRDFDMRIDLTQFNENDTEILGAENFLMYREFKFFGASKAEFLIDKSLKTLKSFFEGKERKIPKINDIATYISMRENN